MTVAKSGVSTQYSSGGIISTNYSGYFHSTYFTDLVSCNVYVDGGDSGGPVFIPTNTNGGATLIGIVKAKSSDTNYLMYFVKEQNILSMFGYTRY